MGFMYAKIVHSDSRYNYYECKSGNAVGERFKIPFSPLDPRFAGSNPAKCDKTS
jgi:hypothetical protein